jgi:internalin A
MVFYRSNLFDNQLVLDQPWALSAVYAVFTRKGAVYDTRRRLGGASPNAPCLALARARTG